MPQVDKEKRKEYNRRQYLKNKCIHGRQKYICRECGGSQICEHDRIKSSCRDCGGGSICPHGRIKTRCRECGGGSICEHDRRKSNCRECGGGSICEHDCIVSICRECGGGSICEHGHIKHYCRDCGGNGICEHGRRNYECRECGGSQICEHDRIKQNCRKCGGSRFCEHDRIKSICHDCNGSQLCSHDRQKRQCRDCSPNLYIIYLQRHNIYRIMKQTTLEKRKPSIEYLGCSAEYFRDYIKSKMTEEMTFENIHFDHIKPVSAFDLEIEDELLDCCHYTNFQPLLANDNLCKSCKWNDEDEVFWKDNIKGKEYLPLYLPKG